MKRIKTAILVKKNYLIFRREAKTLKNLILAQTGAGKSCQVVLDFSQVKFISRSFADEFFNLLSDLESKNIKTSFARLSPQVKPLLAAVCRRRNWIKKEFDSVR